MTSIAQENTGISYGRNYAIDFFPLDKQLQSFTLGQAGQLTEVQYEPGLGVEFQINKTVPGFGSSTTTKAVIKLYNISDATARALQVPGLFVIRLGYDSSQITFQLFEVFTGVSANATYGREGVDTFIQFELGMGDLAFKDRYVELSYDRGVTMEQILKDVGKKIMNDYYPVISYDAELVYPPEIRNIKYKEPISFRGDAIEVLADLLPNYYVYLNRRKIEIFRKVDSFNNDQVIGSSIPFNPDFGQIGFIKPTSRVSYGANKVYYAGVEAQSLLFAQADINSIIRVTPSDLQKRFDPSLDEFVERDDFFYQVTSVSHQGNSFRGPFTTTWRGDLINTFAKEES